MQLDANFIEGPRRGPIYGILRVVGRGLLYVFLRLLAFLPIRALSFLVFLFVIAESLMAVTYITQRHDPLGAAGCVMMIVLALFAIGALLHLRNWLGIARIRWG